MRFFAGPFAIVVAVALADVPLSAQAALWCAEYRTGGTNCGFSTHAQCLNTVSGIGGFCRQDPSQGARPAEREIKRANRSAKQESKAAARRTRQPAPITHATAAKNVAPAAVTPAPPASSVKELDRRAFAAARKLILDGEYDAGLSALRSLGSDDNPDVASYIGLAHRKLGRNEEAKSWYEKALAADPKHLETLAFYGVLRVEQGDLVGARLDLQKIGLICGNTTCNEYVGLSGVITAKAR